MSGATYVEVVGVLFSPTRYEQITIGCNHFIIALKDQKPTASCPAERMHSPQSLTLHKSNRQNFENSVSRVLYEKVSL